MEENKEMKNSQVRTERTYTQSEVEALASQWQLKFEDLQKELQRRDLSNFYQTISILFEIIRNREAHSEDFVKKCVSIVESSINNLLSGNENTTESKKDE